MWHYNLAYITPYSEEGLNRIFTSIMKWFFTPFPSSVSQAVPNVVKASIDVYESVSGVLRPTPTKSHYSFNLRDLSKIFQVRRVTSPWKIFDQSRKLKPVHFPPVDVRHHPPPRRVM